MTSFLGRLTRLALVVVGNIILFSALTCTSYSIPNSRGGGEQDHSLVFSLKEYQKQCAMEASTSLDASRLHFQILFVDEDNAQGRIAEGLLAKIAEDNDAMCVLFPASATVSSSHRAPRDAAASSTVLHICESLGLCPTRSETMGTEFSTSYLDEYDLVVCLSEDVLSRIVRSLPREDQEYYRPRCRLLSEFLSSHFVSNSMAAVGAPTGTTTTTETTTRTTTTRRITPTSTSTSTTTEPEEPPQDTASSSLDIKTHLMEQRQWKMLDAQYQDRIEPYLDQIADRSSNLFAESDLVADWPTTQAGLIWACAGIAQFCLATLDAQLQASLDVLLERNVYKPEHLHQSWQDVDMQLCKCNAHVTGYFSPGQRKFHFERHRNRLQAKFQQQETGNDPNEDETY